MEYTIEKLLAEEQWKQLNVIEGKESCKRKIEGIIRRLNPKLSIL